MVWLGAVRKIIVMNKYQLLSWQTYCEVFDVVLFSARMELIFFLVASTASAVLWI